VGVARVARLPGHVDLPEYRRPAAVIRIDGTSGSFQITGQQISPRDLPEGVREHVGEAAPLRQPIGEIEAMVERARADGVVRLTLPESQEVAKVMNYEGREFPFQHVATVYWALGEPALRGVVDQVRTTLVELVAEMRSVMPAAAATPSAEVANHAVQVAVHGGDARVNVTAARTSGAGSRAIAGAARASSRWGLVGGLIVGLATVVAAAVALAQWLGWGF